MSKPIPENVVFFDGVCKLCNGWVQFLLKFDRKNNLKFATLSSQTAGLLKQDHMQLEQVDSVFFFQNNKVYMKSNAVFKIIEQLGGTLKVLLIFSLLPTVLTDWVYDIVAKNRYSLYGKNNSCMVPKPAHAAKFLD